MKFKFTGITIVIVLAIIGQSCTPYLQTSQPSSQNFSTTPTRVNSTKKTTVDRKSIPQTNLVFKDDGWADWKSVTKGANYDKLWLINIYPEACRNCNQFDTRLSVDEEFNSFIKTTFIPFKVSSLERPDLYQIAKSMMASNPSSYPNSMITILALPDGTPFWSGSMTDVISWGENIKFFADTYKQQPAKVEKIGEETVLKISLLNAESSAKSSGLHNRYLDNLVQKTKLSILQKSDDVSLETYKFLLRYYYTNNNVVEQKQMLNIISKMANDNWKLIDDFSTGYQSDMRLTLAYQSQQLMLFAEAYQITKEVKYKKAGFQIINFMQREMWNKNRIAFVSFPTSSMPESANRVVTSWNAYALKACVEAYKAFGEERFLGQALGIANYFKYTTIHESGAIWHSSELAQAGFLDDYAALADALISLYQVTFDEQWLESANQIIAFSLPYFRHQNLMAFQTNDNQILNLSATILDVADHTTHPSANAIYAQTLYQLGVLYHKDNYRNMAEEMLLTGMTSGATQKDISGLASWSILYNMMVAAPYEVAILGNQADKFKRQFDQHYLPYILFTGGNTEGNLPSLEGKLIDGETFIYVCKGSICNMPTQEISEAISMMK